MSEPMYPPSLLHRRQFFYGPREYPDPAWKSFPMPGGACLSAHPDLDVTQLAHGPFQVTLLGFLLDPARPADRNAQVLLRLSEAAVGIPEWIELTEPLSGRWVIFLSTGDQTVVFNDAGSLRSVYYYNDAAGKRWLATQPDLIAGTLGLEFSPEGVRYKRSPRYQEKDETWWPGESTAYAGLKHLLPNHLLDLQTGQAQRFWPLRALEHHSLKDGVRLASELMKGTVASAHARFPLAMSLSSGYDSRLVFSACRDFASELFIFSLLYRKLTPGSDDVRVPAEILSSLGLEHHIIDAREPLDPAFADLYTRNVPGVKDDWGPIVQARFHNVPSDRMVLKGNISEIVRCRFWDLGVYPYRVTLRDLVRKINLGDDPLVISDLKAWMADALPVEKLGYRLLDILSWEIEIGNWMGMAPMFFDLAQDEFSPFSNRRFLNIMLGVDPAYRSYPYHVMEREMVASLWPELAKFPYSPSRKVHSKRWYDGTVLNVLRWGRYLLFEEKHGRLDE